MHRLSPRHWIQWIVLFLMCLGPLCEGSAASDSPEHEATGVLPPSTNSAPPASLSEQQQEKTPSSAKYNLVFVVSDQLRFDALRFVQDELSQYDGKLKISTPNIDRLAKMGVVFENTYCQAPVCGSSRGSFMTGTTIRRTGMSSNSFMGEKTINAHPVHRERIERMRTFEQILIDE
jgi:Sulfatase